MVVTIGTTFPVNWQYGPEEIALLESTAKQINAHLPNDRNLLINTTWFGPQFINEQWNKVLELIAQQQEFENLFLLAVIDPMYLQPSDLEFIKTKLKIKKVYEIGMFANSEYEWNFHSFAVAQHCPRYTEQQLLANKFDYTFLLYQRKPRAHRIELTNILLDKNYAQYGIITLGANDADNQTWGQGLTAPLLTIDDDPIQYKHNGAYTDFGGIPNDLVSVGRLDLWQRHFLNIISETEFNEWHPRFVTEKTWKPILGLRPFIIHGQRSIYAWLRGHGFKTFNDYWSHIPVETSDDQHGTVVAVIDFLCQKSKQELSEMYFQMLPDLQFNRQRYFEFASDQKYKSQNLFR
jgi:hypothetical protein